MGLRVKTAPANDAVELAEAMDHLGAFDESEQQVRALIGAAQTRVETYLGRALITQTLVFTLDCFPWRIRLPRPPLQSVTHIKYMDPSTSTLATVSSSDYRITTGDEPTRIEPTYGSSWPTPQPVTEAVEIEYVAGYGDDYSSVPEDIRHAILLLVGEWYEHREGMAARGQQIPHAVEWLLNGHRVGGLFAGRGLNQ